MHEIYLLRIAAHAKLREDSNFRVFLEYAKDVSGKFTLPVYITKFSNLHILLSVLNKKCVLSSLISFRKFKYLLNVLNVHIVILYLNYHH